jgi:Methyltransferase domain
MPTLTFPPRASRIARGLLNADTRPRYVQSGLNRVHLAGRVRLVRPTRTDGLCSVCLSRRVRAEQVTYAKDATKSFPLQICEDCGYVANPKNFNDYREYESLDQFPITARVGTDERPGREYHMARMGVSMLPGKALDVMIFGPGRSVDYKRVQTLPKVANVRIGDVVKLHDRPDFINVLEKTDARFDLIIASEVIEHFTDPGNDFPRLFGLLKKRGLLVCSTNINDGSDLTKHTYLYIKGHTSYYSPGAIERLATDNGMRFDCRLPIAATTFAGPRKRYIFFTPSYDRLSNIARYFAAHPYAPSEK